MPIEIFHLPDAGEGLTEAEIVRWLVEPGDSVSVNQMVVEIETAKATVELPIPWAGVVSEIHEEIGDVVLRELHAANEQVHPVPPRAVPDELLPVHRRHVRYGNRHEDLVRCCRMMLPYGVAVWCCRM